MIIISVTIPNSLAKATPLDPQHQMLYLHHRHVEKGSAVPVYVGNADMTNQILQHHSASFFVVRTIKKEMPLPSLQLKTACQQGEISYTRAFSTAKNCEHPTQLAISRSQTIASHKIIHDNIGDHKHSKQVQQLDQTLSLCAGDVIIRCCGSKGVALARLYS